MTDTLRRDTKQALVNLLTPTSGIKNVWPYMPKSIVGPQHPYIIVFLPKAKETALTMSRPKGKKQIEFTAQISVYYEDTSADGSGQLNFDDLLDAIDDQMRSEPNLNASPVGTTGVVLASAVEHIDTIVPPSILNGQTIQMMAIKQFDVTVQVNG